MRTRTFDFRHATTTLCSLWRRCWAQYQDRPQLSTALKSTTELPWDTIAWLLCHKSPQNTPSGFQEANLDVHMSTILRCLSKCLPHFSLTFKVSYPFKCIQKVTRIVHETPYITFTQIQQSSMHWRIFCSRSLSPSRSHSLSIWNWKYQDPSHPIP